jgi:peptidoglycan/xylan/chitin deacetylase (PgdA/CDA1 family)
LRRLGFQFWPLRRLLLHHAKGLPVPPRTVAVTFDDGFESVYVHAWPVLRELQIPATVFLATAYMDGDDPFPFDPWGATHPGLIPPSSYRPLRWDQCRKMQSAGLVDLGAHTHTHRDFRGRAEQFEEDLATCVKVLRQQLHVEEVSFAFPFGRRHTGFSGDELMDAARRAGVTCGLTTEAELVDVQSDPFGWGRFNVYDFDTGETVAAKLEGWYSWAPRLQSWLWQRSKKANGSSAPGHIGNGSNHGRQP